MYDMSHAKKQTFDVTLPNGDVIGIYPPKLKTIKKLLHFQRASTKGDDYDIDELANAISLLVSHNQQKKTYSANWIIENMDLLAEINLVDAYIHWVNSLKTKN